jgi:hypothetical protein
MYRLLASGLAEAPMRRSLPFVLPTPVTVCDMLLPVRASIFAIEAPSKTYSRLIYGAAPTGTYFSRDSVTATVHGVDAARRNQQYCVGRVSEAQPTGTAQTQSGAMPCGYCALRAGCAKGRVAVAMRRRRSKLGVGTTKSIAHISYWPTRLRRRLQQSTRSPEIL